MKAWIVATMLALASAGAGTETALATSDNSSCVGQFSSFFAHGGGDRHRSEVAQQFAKDEQPAGRNVYSQVAKLHGTLEECSGQT
jgi:hypothetical protein